jgi:F-type H+-transporting ATPase subunit b
MQNLFAQVLYLAVEEPEGIDLVLPDTAELIGGIIAFALVFAFVWFKARPAISRTLTARQEAITGQLSAAEESKKEAESLLADYKQQLAKAREEANRIMDEARQSADALRQEIVAKAEADAETIGRKAREDAAAERERVSGQIRDEVATLALDLAQKAVSGTIDSTAQQALLDQYLSELEGMSS